MNGCSIISDDVGSQPAQTVQELLLDSEDITSFLHEFTALLADRLGNADKPIWCAISLLRERKADTAAASSSEADALDELQNSFSDGPCMTAIREHTVIRVGDVREDSRWADYHAAAAEQGVRSVLGLPFEMHEDARAGLNVYSTTPNDFAPEMIETIRHEVRQASSALRLAVRLAGHRETEQDLHAAMASRTVINLAVGIVMGQNHCSQNKAVEILKDASSHRNIKLRELAREIVASVDSRAPQTQFES